MAKSPVTAHHPDALLCERCGYSIAGLQAEQPCPECGQTAGLSWVENRPGSLFQQNGHRSGRWVWSSVEVVRSPGALFRRVRIDPGSSWRYLFVNLMIVATLAAVGYCTAAHALWMDAALVIWVGTFGGLLLLTWVETLGLRFFAQAESRRWRITNDVAWTVCQHASIGWVMGGLVMLAVFVFDPAGWLIESTWFNTLLYRRFNGTLASDYFLQMRAGQMLLPLIAGVLAFETLVYLGVRQCRFANTPASAAQQGAPGGPAGGASTRGDDTAAASA